MVLLMEFLQAVPVVSGNEQVQVPAPGGSGGPGGGGNGEGQSTTANCRDN